MSCLVTLRRERKAGAKSDYQLFHITPSASLLNIRMEQFGSHETDFSEILWWGYLLTSACRIQAWFKSDRNNRQFA